MAGEAPRDLKRRLAMSLKRMRRDQGLTQERAAEKADLNIRHWQKLEDGSVNATLDTLENLSRGLGVEIVDLFESQA